MKPGVESMWECITLAAPGHRGALLSAQNARIKKVVTHTAPAGDPV